MNIQFKTFLLATALSPLFIACNNDVNDNTTTTTTTTTDSATAKNDGAHEHAYACPMHQQFQFP